MDLGLTGKVVVVTGASRGIGLATCRRFLTESATVVALHRSGSDELDELVRSNMSPSSGPVAESVVLDVTDDEACATCVAGILERHGRIDVLVNNAGVTLERPFLATKEDDVRALAEVNQWAPMRLLRLVLKPMMLARSGSVVNVSSAVASKGGRGVAAYAATKAAVESLTRVLAIEMARKGVRLNAVAPGLIGTRMSDRLMRRSRLSPVDRIPMQRAGTPEDVAAAIAWLASDRVAGYVTGHVLRVDGGYRL